MGTEAGWRQFAQADWAGARDAFAVALEERPADPEALDGLGQSLWWLGERTPRSFAAARPSRCSSGAETRARAGLSRRTSPRAPDRRAARRGSGLARRAAACSRRRLRPGAWLAASRRRSGRRTPRRRAAARPALEVAHALGDPNVECMALASSAARSPARVASRRARPARRGDAVALGGGRGPARLRRRLLHHARGCDSLADVRAPRSGARPRRVHLAPRLRPLRVVVSRDLRRRPVRGRGGAREDVLTEALRRPPDRRRGAARCRCRSPSCACARADDEAARLLAGIEDEPAALCRRSSTLQLGAATSPYAQALLDQRAGDAVGLLVLRGAPPSQRRATARAGRGGLRAPQRRARRTSGRGGAPRRPRGRRARRPAGPRGALEDAGAASRARVPARGGPGAAPLARSRPAKVRRSRRRLRAPPATPSSASAPVPTPTEPPPCCAISRAAARRPAASATS